MTNIIAALETERMKREVPDFGQRAAPRRQVRGGRTQIS